MNTSPFPVFFAKDFQALAAILNQVLYFSLKLCSSRREPKENESSLFLD